ncbi:MAG TPA: PIN domain-containing protein [Acidobacteriaceae bacterium]|jgi:predicted nucleic acid-binding protein
MSGRYFLDTNVLAYCFDVRAPQKRARANQLVREGLERRTAVISYQIVQEFINVARRKFEPKLEFDDIRQYARSVLMPLLGVSSSMALTHRALDIAERYRFPWYDSLMIAAALAAQCEVLYSEDWQHGQRIEGLQIVNPFL